MLDLKWKKFKKMMSCIVSKNCVSPDADFPTNSKKQFSVFDLLFA